jgi:hypothetical protein
MLLRVNDTQFSLSNNVMAISITGKLHSGVFCEKGAMTLGF